MQVPGQASPQRRRIGAFLALVVMMGVWALLAPPERGLGEGIRIVYLHVAASWAGSMTLYAGGLLGLVLTLRPGREGAAWLRSLGWVALILFGTGFALSLVAAQVNWGGVLWREPRTAASFRILATMVLAQIVCSSRTPTRLHGLAWFAVAVHASWALRAAALFFHPERPIQAETPWAIRGTFYGLFVLMLAAGVVLLLAIHRPGGARSLARDPDR